MSLLKKLRNQKLQKAVAVSVLALGFGISNDVSAYKNPYSDNAVYTGNSTVVVGSEAEALEKAGATAVGYQASASNSGTAVGAYSNASQDGTAVGYRANASGTDSIAIGDTVNATAIMSIALGFDSDATEVGAIVLGARSSATAEDAIAIGKDTEANYNSAIAVGADSFANAAGSVVIGTNAGISSSGVSSVAVGGFSRAYGTHSLALGSGADSSADYSVAIGSNSEASEAYTVSFGSGETKRRLVNVAAGTAQTDAVNVSQLISKGSYNAETKQLSLQSNSGSNVLVDLSALPEGGAAYTAGDGIIIADDVISVKKDGTVTEGNTDVVTGGTVYDAVKNKADITYIDAELANKADTDLGNITDGGKGVVGDIAEEALADDLNAKANVNASNVAGFTAEWGAAIGTGIVEDGNSELVTGDTVYEAVKDKADADLGNLTEDGKDVIKNIAQNSVKVEDGLNTTVTRTENEDGSLTYKVNVEGSGKAEAGNTGLISGDTLYNTVNEINENITNVTEGINAELDGKADADASNVADHTAEWGAAIGTGKVEAGNGELVTGNTVYEAVKDKADADFGNLTEDGKGVIGDIAQDALQDDLDGKANTVASNIETDKWADKLGTGTIADGDKSLVNGDTVYDAIKNMGGGLVMSDGKTITVGKNDGAAVIDVARQNSDGSTENRVITGVQTDSEDMSSAANVGYVNQSVGQLASDFNRGLSELDNQMKKGVAGAAALAALNPLDYDPENKLNFAAGVGSYKGENATALGMFYRPNENVMFSLGGAFGNGENMWNAGITFNLDKPSTSTSKAAMARAIKTMAADNDALEAKAAEQDAKIAQLTAQVQALLEAQGINK